jgi:hypothetical protein
MKTKSLGCARGRDERMGAMGEYRFMKLMKIRKKENFYDVFYFSGFCF